VNAHPGQGGSSLRALLVPVYVPSLLFATGQGAIVPVLALAAKDLGASSAQAGLVVAANGLGTVAFDISAGSLVAAVGEQGASSLAAIMVIAGLVIAILSASLLMLGVGIFVSACGWAVWVLVRLTHLSRVAPPATRGRTLSVLGGVMRAGAVLGPFLLLALATSRPAKSAFLIYLVCAVVGFGMLHRARDPHDRAGRQRAPERTHPVRIVGEHRREFATAGVGAFTICMLRASRQVVVPLWGAHIGLSLASISLIFALSSAVDLALFYPAGVISDRFGRPAAALPCLVLLACGHLALPLTHGFAALMIVATVLGIGNGLGSGIVMTLGADRSPSIGRAPFLAVWRLFCDAGTASGPLACAAVASVLTLGAAGPVLGLVGLAGTFVVVLFMRDPHPSMRVSRVERPAHGA
jgi:MFS family permease